MDKPQRKILSPSQKVIVVCLFVAAVGLILGLNREVLARIQQLNINFALYNEFEIPGWLDAALMVSPAVGAILAGWLSAKIGRKYSLLCATIIFVIAGLANVFLRDLELFFLSRCFSGLALGIASCSAPLYLAEIAPKKIRGGMISFYQLLWTTGVTLAYLPDTYFSYLEAWQWIFCVVVVPTFILFLGILFVPRSPRWLAAKGKNAEAREVLVDMHDTSEEVDKELQDIENGLNVKKHGWSLFWKNKNFRRSVGLGMLLQVMNQVTGFSIVLGTAADKRMWGLLLVSFFIILAGFMALFLVDKWGRRPVLLVGYSFMSISMSVLAVLAIHPFLLFVSGSMYYLILVALALFLIGYAMSANPLTWVLCSEIHPLRGREFGVTVSTTTSWIVGMIVAFYSLRLFELIGLANIFWIFAGLSFISIFLVWFFVPETKGVSLEKIEGNLMSGKKLRDIGS